ncbi:MAG TPA: arginine--tRNA ligase, partial [Aquifex sp.]|nr:arginine--tRNA ligase [Aquifex sp.]
MQGFLKKEIQNLIKQRYNLSGIEFKVERPKRKEFGDLATNVAFILAKHLKGNPFEIANEIAEELRKNSAF